MSFEILMYSTQDNFLNLTLNNKLVLGRIRLPMSKCNLLIYFVFFYYTLVSICNELLKENMLMAYHFV